MTMSKFKEIYGFSMDDMTDKELNHYFKENPPVHPAEVADLIQHITIHPRHLREFYTGDDHSLLAGILSAYPTPQIRTYQETIERLITTKQLLLIYEHHQSTDSNGMKWRLSHGMTLDRHMTIALRHYYHNQTKLCKGNVTRMLTQIKTDPDIYSLLEKEKNWNRRKSFAVLRIAIKRSFPRIIKSILNAEFVIYQNRFMRHINLFI